MSEYKNIHKVTSKNGKYTYYEVCITVREKTYCKTFKSLKEAIKYREYVFNELVVQTRREEYPENLIESIFGNYDKPLDYLILLENIDNRILRTLQNFPNFLSEREIFILDSLYPKGRTLEQTGKELNLTRERVRQIECKIINKFRKIKESLLLDDETYYLYLKSNELREKYNSLITHYQVKIDRVNDEIKNNDIKSYPVEELDLSLRAYNCLKRSKIYNIEQLSNYSFEDLLKIKNLGKTSAKEIRQALRNRFGLDLRRAD